MCQTNAQVVDLLFEASTAANKNDKILLLTQARAAQILSSNKAPAMDKYCY